MCFYRAVHAIDTVVSQSTSVISLDGILHIAKAKDNHNPVVSMTIKKMIFELKLKGTHANDKPLQIYNGSVRLKTLSLYMQYLDNKLTQTPI